MSTTSRLAPIFVAMILGATVVVAAPACGDDGETTGTGGAGTGGDATDGDEDADGEEVDIADVVYGGGATDEALEELLATAPMSDPAEAASFSAPAADAVLPAATPAVFTWALPTQGTFLDLDRVEPGRFRQPGALERAATTALGALFASVSEAHAHGDPVNGRAYFVVFSTAADDRLLRVFTKETSYTPDDAAWTKLKSAGAPITASITSAVFESNRVALDGGPFTGDAVTFTIAAE